MPQEYMVSFRRSLAPFLELLEHQKLHVNPSDWYLLVERLVTRITENPEQYLEQDLPAKEVTSELVKEIFDEFILRHKAQSEEIQAD